MPSLRFLLSLLAIVVAAPAAAAPHARPALALEAVTPPDLDVPQLTLRLPGSGTWMARRTYLERDDQTSTWIGEVSASPGSRVTITRHRSVTTGVAVVDGRTFELRADGRGALVASEVRDRDLPPQEPPPGPATAATQRKADIVDWSALGMPSADVAPVTQDVLIFYTAASARRYGANRLESMIVGGVAAANAAYRDSGVGITLRLVGLQRAATVSESSAGMIATLTRFKAAPEVAQLRDQLGADMTLLVNENDDWCGYAYIMYRPSVSYADDAFGAVRAKCLSTESIAHELGHLQGLMHDRSTLNADGALPYGHGYRRCERGGFRDVMAYPCPDVDVPRLRLFSNPDRLYRGVPLGIAYETDPARSADAARALNATAALVASYRPSMTTGAPGAPLALSASSLGRAARLTWRDGATDTAAFVVERAGTGDYEAIARLTARTTTFRDRTVEPGRTYAYRVRATNGSGASAASNTATVTIDAEAVPRIDGMEDGRPMRLGGIPLLRR